MIGLYMIICMGMAMIGSAAAPVFVKKIPAKVMTIVGFLSDIIMGVIIMILGRGSLSVLFVCFGIVGFFIGVRLVTITVMLMQTAQYIAEKNGSRADGICFSLNSFANKIGQALAGAGRQHDSGSNRICGKCPADRTGSEWYPDHKISASGSDRHCRTGLYGIMETGYSKKETGIDQNR